MEFIDNEIDGCSKKGDQFRGGKKDKKIGVKNASIFENNPFVRRTIFRQKD